MKNAMSLAELTSWCRDITKREFIIGSVSETHPSDVRWYVTDNSRTMKCTGWEPKRSAVETVRQVHDWMTENHDMLAPIFGGKS